VDTSRATAPAPARARQRSLVSKGPFRSNTLDTESMPRRSSVRVGGSRGSGAAVEAGVLLSTSMPARAGRPCAARRAVRVRVLPCTQRCTRRAAARRVSPGTSGLTNRTTAGTRPTTHRCSRSWMLDRVRLDTSCRTAHAGVGEMVLSSSTKVYAENRLPNNVRIPRPLAVICGSCELSHLHVATTESSGCPSCRRASCLRNSWEVWVEFSRSSWSRLPSTPSRCC